MEQGTVEWLKLRKNKVTATDAAPILGVCQYRSAYMAWLDKFSPVGDLQDNEATRHGKAMEPVARQLFNTATENNMCPDIVIKDWQMASLDGYNKETNEFLEIKCPYYNARDHETALSKKIPEKYLPQIAHQFLVTGCETGWYFSYFKESQAFFKIDKNIFSSFYFDRLMEAEKHFYFECMQELTPPKLSDADYVNLEGNEEAEKLIKDWKDAKAMADYYGARETNYRDALENICQNKNAMGYGVKLTKIIRRGNIEYNAIPQLKEVDLELYRKPPVEFWRIVGKE